MAPIEIPLYLGESWRLQFWFYRELMDDNPIFVGRYGFLISYRLQEIQEVVFFF